MDFATFLRKKGDKRQLETIWHFESQGEFIALIVPKLGVMMKKLLILLSAIAFVFGFCGVCVGALYKIEDVTTFLSNGTNEPGDLNSHGGDYVNKLEYSGDWVNWTHYYNFNPPADTILSGKLEIYLRDDENDSWSPWTWDFAIGWGEDGTWDLGEVDTGTYEYNVNVGYLEDGKFTIQLKSLWGDFDIDYSKLSIEYESDHVSVPDSSIMFLLGPSLIVLGVFSRRKFRK
jgi:hypothetical protein